MTGSALLWKLMCIDQMKRLNTKIWDDVDVNTLCQNKEPKKKPQPTVLCFDSITRCISSLQNYCCSSIPDRKNGSRLWCGENADEGRGTIRRDEMSRRRNEFQVIWGGSFFLVYRYVWGERKHVNELWKVLLQDQTSTAVNPLYVGKNLLEIYKLKRKSRKKSWPAYFCLLQQDWSWQRSVLV